MNDSIILNKPTIHSEIEKKYQEIGFTMPSDLYVGTLLKTLITSKPKSNLLELGTGIGLSLSWMLDGMDAESKITSVDNDPELIEMAKHHFSGESRLQLINADASQWIKEYQGAKFDLIFADAWPGKYSELDLVLDLLKTGGFYIIDDMMAQPNWPDGHQKNVDKLIEYLEDRNDLNLTKMNWSTGIIIAVKKY
ncbi:O-methyltransferase [Leeuwenhoekiella aestuarii]|uniref:Putative O-methyltransferase YrrM n=1 Tax=Leeuwenhoekiella aestuarii TaxID=2249426 RepID=A0A4Q0NZZ7_9FLAO|nr:class I SAM-dependent methyltransferase [Leeuwenhoekiella aestuarii]RXG16922.1 putative O-methyltransferase YrrM [Leeuwenhoekiella aestuarii]